MDANFNSVSLLPFDRMAAITCERFFFEKTSAIASGAHSTEDISVLKVQSLKFVRFAVAIGIGIFECAGDFVTAGRVIGQIADVLKSLGLGLAQVFTERFVLDEQDARPEQINAPVVAGNFLHGLFKTGDDAAFDAEDLKEFVPEGLFLGALAFDAGPFAGELDRVVADFVPTDRHGATLAQAGIADKHGKFGGGNALLVAVLVGCANVCRSNEKQNPISPEKQPNQRAGFN